MPAVIANRCPQDHPCPCVRVCPVGAISQQGFSEPKIEAENCTECGVCTSLCPYQAITDTAAGAAL